MDCPINVSSLTLEGYTELYNALTKSQERVQPVPPLEEPYYKTNDLKQVHLLNGVPGRARTRKEYLSLLAGQALFCPWWKADPVAAEHNTTHQLLQSPSPVDSHRSDHRAQGESQPHQPAGPPPPGLLPPDHLAPLQWVVPNARLSAALAAAPTPLLLHQDPHRHLEHIATPDRHPCSHSSPADANATATVTTSTATAAPQDTHTAPVAPSPQPLPKFPPSLVPTCPPPDLPPVPHNAQHPTAVTTSAAPPLPLPPPSSLPDGALASSVADGGGTASLHPPAQQLPGNFLHQLAALVRQQLLEEPRLRSTQQQSEQQQGQGTGQPLCEDDGGAASIGTGGSSPQQEPKLAATGTASNPQVAGAAVSSVVQDPSAALPGGSRQDTEDAALTADQQWVRDRLSQVVIGRGRQIDASAVDEGAMVGRRVAFFLLEELLHTGTKGIQEVLPAGLYEGRVVEDIGTGHQEDVCGGGRCGCHSAHHWFYVRLLLPRGERTRSTRRMDLKLDLQASLRCSGLEAVTKLHKSELQDVWMLITLTG